MSPFFQLEQVLQDLNIIFCELVSLQTLTGGHHGVSHRTSRGRSRTTNPSILGSTNAWSTQTLRVGDYILQLLRGEGVTPSQLGKPLTRDAYIALLPSIWALLNSTREDLHEMSVAVLHSIIDLSIRTSCKSALKTLTIEFIARLVLVRNVSLSVWIGTYDHFSWRATLCTEVISGSGGRTRKSENGLSIFHEPFGSLVQTTCKGRRCERFDSIRDLANLLSGCSSSSDFCRVSFNAKRDLVSIQRFAFCFSLEDVQRFLSQRA